MLKGFVTWSSAPASSALIFSSEVRRADRTRIGTRLQSRTPLITSMPIGQTEVQQYDVRLAEDAVLDHWIMMAGTFADMLPSE